MVYMIDLGYQIITMIDILSKNNYMISMVMGIRDRLMIPIRNEDGVVIGFGGRLLPEKSNQLPKNSVYKAAKYINSPTSLGYCYNIIYSPNV